ncbi:multicopper oxidase family protein [Streptomyces sp. NBC_00829]|uniref:multicopper oxidase family protein n=1 Tax=Streptomyces sp. NBC_00829 TaxID=2903679 RepID=UPI00386A2AFA|nr:multicopper oxidase domain-containing protein [Streptomyces sp. NBC_00829]
MLNRRQLLRRGAAAGLLVAAPAGLIVGGRPGSAEAATAAFTVPLAVPRPLRPARRAGRDLYRLVTQEGEAAILPGARTRIRGFGGTLAPLIVAHRDRPVVVELGNRLAEPFALHLHGGHVPVHSDGHPKDQIEPGGRRTYCYPNAQRAMTLWMHDHTHHAHAENIYRGLAATYLLTDRFEEQLPLPKGQYDVVLQLRDAKFDENNALVYDMHRPEDRPTILVNARPRPYFEVAARKYRLRLVNTANERGFFLRLSDGTQAGAELVQIAADGGLLPAPAPTGALALWPGERNEVVVDFSRYPVGTELVLENLAAFEGETPEVMRFDVVRTAPDPSSVPAALRPAPDLGTPAVRRDFHLAFDPASGQHLINGKPFDISRVDIRPRLNVTEVWTIRNSDTLGIPHSLHPHLEQFRVLSRDGRPPAPGEAGLKDTITVMAGQSAEIALRFTDYTGPYMYHCHMLGHQMMGMMGQMEIVR